MARDFLDALEEQLVQATRQGEIPRVKRVRRRIARWVSTPLAGVAIAVAGSATAIAAGVTGPLSDGASQQRAAHAQQPVHRYLTVHSRSASPVASAASASSRSAAPLTTPGAIPAGGPVPSGFQPQSFTAISEYTWWLMGPAPCPHQPCTSIVRTVNGGRSFVGLHAPRSVRVSQLRFANEDDGFAFGPRLWVTHDGGETWHELSLHGSVNELAAADGYVFAIVWRKHGSVLMRSPVGVNRWTRIPPRRTQPFSGLWVQGPEVIVETQSPSSMHQYVDISHDSGRRFARVGQAPPSVACSFDMTPGGTIWAPCATGMMSGIWRSTDGGRSFHVATGASRGAPGVELPNSAAFGAATGRVAVVGYQRLYRTTNGGARWREVKSVPLAQDTAYIGFTDATHGVVIERFGSNEQRGWRLYYTTDAGAGYHYVPITS